MKVINEIKAMQEISEFLRRGGKTIGFVPTMGFLHEGHVSLIHKAREENDIVIVSNFVNPTQFGPSEDLNRYPRDFVRDYEMCKTAGVDYIFNPSAEEIYPAGYKTYVYVNDISDKYEGKTRPGHFRGVATIVLKLFNITKPHTSYFGQKDAQQVIVIRKMIEDLNIDIKLKVMPTIREANGLAKSSRNTYLTPELKDEAAILYKTLNLGKELILSSGFNDRDDLIYKLRSSIETNSPNSSLDYIAITNNTDMSEINDIKNYRGGVLISLAVWYGKTRLIDNILLEKQ